MDGMELRPLSTGEILDRTFTLYRRRFLLFFGISAIPHILVLALNLTQSYLLSGVANGVPSGSGGLNGQSPVMPAGPMAAGFGILLLALLVSMVAYLLVQGATVTAVSEIYLGHDITIGDIFSASARRARHVVRRQLVEWTCHGCRLHPPDHPRNLHHVPATAVHPRRCD